MHGIIAVHDQMISQSRGHVVTSSVYGYHPVGGAAVYGATKTAVHVLGANKDQFFDKPAQVFPRTRRATS